MRFLVRATLKRAEGAATRWSDVVVANNEDDARDHVRRLLPSASELEILPVS